MTTGKSDSGSGRVPALAALARIAIPDERIASLEKEFDAIIGYIDQLQSLSATDSTTPSSIATAIPLRNVFRDDSGAHEPGAMTERIVNAFPARDGDALSVRKIISHD